MDNHQWRSTTVLCVKKGNKVAMAGDGQVTLGETVVKGNARKIRRLHNGKVLSGFAGSAADAFALLDKFENKLEQYRGDIMRASVEMAKEWRTDKILRELQAMLLVANTEHILVISGNGNVLEPENNISSIGSGSPYARAAALAFFEADTDMSAREIAEKSLHIASQICIYTNSHIQVEEL